MKLFMLAMSLLLLPTLAEAKLIFTEIMYDPSGTDTGHEWVEIYNDGTTVEDLSQVTFFEEGVNHKLRVIIGTTTLEAGQYGIIADDAEKFRLDWPNYGNGDSVNPLFDSSFSLKNTGESLVLKRDGEELDSIVYDSALGGQGNGESLQRQLIGDAWSAQIATPGSGVSSVPITTSSASSTSSSSSQIPVDTPQVVPVVSTSISPVSAPTQISSGSGRNFPVEQQIFSKIKASMTALAGAEQILSADIWGLKKEPITNARLIWNFGDGMTKEGRSVSHVFIQPGDYIVFLETSSGEYSTTDRLTVKVVAPNFSLIAADDYLEIQNHDSREVDLYGLELRVKKADGEITETRFAFVPHTLISARTSLRLSFSNLGFSARSLPTLNYLNGSVIATSSVAQLIVAPPSIQSAPKKVSAKTPAKTVKKVSQVVSTASTVILSDTSKTETSLKTDQPESPWKQYGLTALILVGLVLAGLYFFKLPIPLGK